MAHSQFAIGDRSRRSKKNIDDAMRTSRPALLLCRFIVLLICLLLLLLILSTNLSEESINSSAKLNPSFTLSLQSPHFHSPLLSTLPFFDLSHLSQSGKIPALHDLVTEYATPAEVMACMNAVSFVPEVEAMMC